MVVYKSIVGCIVEDTVIWGCIVEGSIVYATVLWTVHWCGAVYWGVSWAWIYGKPSQAHSQQAYFYICTYFNYNMLITYSKTTLYDFQ